MGIFGGPIIHPLNLLEVIMKNRTKTIIMLLALGLLLMLMIGGMVAKERYQSYTVYNIKPEYQVNFEVTDQDQSWSFSVTKHAPGWVHIRVFEYESTHFVLDRYTQIDTSGALSLTYQYHYRLQGYEGDHDPPGNATINVNTNNYGGSGPSGP
jgi:hypothetical protein